MPFDNVHGFPPSRPSGVAAAVAAAADVARVAETPEPRHVDQSCCGERQDDIPQPFLEDGIYTRMWNADEAIREENARLRSEVERLRLTENQVNTLERIAMLLKHWGIVRDAEEIAAIAKRLRGGG